MLGNVMYLHMFKLADTLAVKQELDKYRFVKVVKEIPVKGGKQDEQYLQYEAVSLLDDKRVYTLNNYLCPFNMTSISELEMTLDYLAPMLDESKLEEMQSIIEEIKSLNEDEEKPEE